MRISYSNDRHKYRIRNVYSIQFYNKSSIMRLLHLKCFFFGVNLGIIFVKFINKFFITYLAQKKLFLNMDMEVTF